MPTYYVCAWEKVEADTATEAELKFLQEFRSTPNNGRRVIVARKPPRNIWNTLREGYEDVPNVDGSEKGLIRGSS